MTEQQYTFDTDPFAMAKRIAALENVCDMASHALVDLTNATRIIAYTCEVLCDDNSLHAEYVRGSIERLNHVHDVAHAMSVKMGRSY